MSSADQDAPRAYRVIIQPEAAQGIEEAFRWIQGSSPEAARRWREGMYDAIRSLSTFPSRCAHASEDPYFPEEIRQLLYGKRGGVYRILFTVGEAEGIVSILHVRHSAQKRLIPMPPEDNGNA